jgi:hypothetical protein
MYCAPPGSDAAKVRDFLKGTAEVGKIQIGLSYRVVFELLQETARMDGLRDGDSPTRGGGQGRSAAGSRSGFFAKKRLTHCDGS